MALDVEWNAEDGNLDGDLANPRALYGVGVIDVGVLVTRHQDRSKGAANYLAEAGGRLREDADGKRIVLSRETANMEKLVPRLERGDAGECPEVAIAFTELCYRPDPGKGDPGLPGCPESNA